MALAALKMRRSMQTLTFLRAVRAGRSRFPQVQSTAVRVPQNDFAQATCERPSEVKDGSSSGSARKGASCRRRAGEKQRGSCPRVDRIRHLDNACSGRLADELSFEQFPAVPAGDL